MSVRIPPLTPQANEATIAQAREQAAAATEARRIHKRKANEARRGELILADDEFTLVIANARRQRVPWRDLSEATGMARQVLARLVSQHQQES